MNASITTPKAILAQLTDSQRWHVRISRLFFGLLAANIMIHTALFVFVLPVVTLLTAVFQATHLGSRWHGSQYPTGYMERYRTTLKPLYVRAAVAGAALTIVAVLLYAYATLLGTYFAIVLGMIFLTSYFFMKGLVAGWDLIVDPKGTMVPKEGFLIVNTPKAVKNVVIWNAIFGVFAVSLAFSILGYRENVMAADAYREAQYEQQVLQDAANDSAAQAMSQDSDAQAQEVTPTQEAAPAAPTPVSDTVMTAPTTPVPAAPSIPADDPADLAVMASLARTAAGTLAKDASDSDHGIINGPFNPSNQDLWAGKPRADGYPNYAVVCAIAKDVCTQLNGMGQYLDTPIVGLGNAVTVVRNADVMSGKYTCGHGICTDAQFNLIGRISPALLALHPELR